MTDLVIAHLWQSSLFAGLAWALTVPLRRNGAHVRYWIWFGASLKFLIPFALLVRAGKISEGDLERARASQSNRADGKRLGEVLVEAGCLTWRELERQVRLQI